MRGDPSEWDLLSGQSKKQMSQFVRVYCVVEHRQQANRGTLKQCAQNAEGSFVSYKAGSSLLRTSFTTSNVLESDPVADAPVWEAGSVAALLGLSLDL